MRWPGSLPERIRWTRLDLGRQKDAKTLEGLDGEDKCFTSHRLGSFGRVIDVLKKEGPNMILTRNKEGHSWKTPA